MVGVKTARLCLAIAECASGNGAFGPLAYRRRSFLGATLPVARPFFASHDFGGPMIRLCFRRTLLSRVCSKWAHVRTGSCHSPPPQANLVVLTNGVGCLGGVTMRLPYSE